MRDHHTNISQKANFSLQVDQKYSKPLYSCTWVTILIYSIAPPHWNLCELWPKNWQDKEKFYIFWPFFMNLTQFYPFFLKFDMILAYFSNITLKIWYWDFCKRVKGNWKDKDFWKKLSPMVEGCICNVWN